MTRREARQLSIVVPCRSRLDGVRSSYQTTKISTKGQVVLPRAIREKMNLRAGDSLEARIEGQRIILIPRKRRAPKRRIVSDPLTGLPVLTAGPDAPKLTSKQVAEILAE
jgi:AbrB family looped-hinge helix DNA binding protein